MVDFTPPQGFNPEQNPAPLPTTVSMNPPMVGVVSPFLRVDGQNRDLILESIRSWSRTELLAWAKAWQDYLGEYSNGLGDWINQYVISFQDYLELSNAELRAEVEAVLEQVINNSIELQGLVVNGILNNGVPDFAMLTYNGQSVAPEGELRPGEELRLDSQYGNVGHRLNLSGGPGVYPYLQVSADQTLTGDGGKAVGGLQLHMGEDDGAGVNREYWMVELIGVGHADGPHYRIGGATSGTGVHRPQYFLNSGLVAFRLIPNIYDSKGSRIEVLQNIRHVGNSSLPLFLARDGGNIEQQIIAKGGTAAPGLTFGKEAGTTAAREKPGAGNTLGRIQFGGLRGDGTDSVDTGATIQAVANESWQTTGTRGTRLAALITPNGATAETEALRIYDPAVNQAGMMLLINRGGVTTFSTVTVGAVDSAGTGYRSLRVAN